MTKSDDRQNRDRSPEGRFIYLAYKRLEKAKTAILSVAKLADRKNYSYSEEQAEQIIDYLQALLDSLKEDFRKPHRATPEKFEFK